MWCTRWCFSSRRGGACYTGFMRLLGPEILVR
nr:MAG TPA: hypothetical protein [Caudoviricetes sp.]